MELQYNLSNFDREAGNFPQLPVINMFSEEVVTEKSVALQSRPGLQNSDISFGASPVRSVYKSDGVLSNTLFGVAASSLYSSEGLIGLIDGGNTVSHAGYNDFLFTAAGGQLWGYDGTTLAAIAMPDDLGALKVVTGSSRGIILAKDTQKFYWTEPLDTVVDPLNFASAEYSDDRLLDMLFVGDTLILFGTNTVEFWPVSSDPALPFQPLVGRVFPVGVKSLGCAVSLGSTYAWVTNRNQVCIATPDKVVSDLGLETKIGNSSSVNLWTFTLAGTEFLVLTLDTETWVLNPRNEGRWFKFESYGEDNWLPKCFGAGYFGSSDRGTLLEWSNDYSDFGGVLERRVRGWAPIDSGTIVINNFSVRTNPGRTPFLTSSYLDPQIELRTSRDAGASFTPWKTRSLGRQGAFKQQTRWNGLGMFSYPGLLAEIRVTDPVPFRVSGLSVNDKYVGSQ